MTRPSPSNHRYALFVLACAVIGVLLRYPLLSSGFAIDDYAQLAMLDGQFPVKRPAWDLYNFSDGSVEEADALRHAGFFPWFTHREIRLSMLRPLSSLLIALDHRLFGNDAFPFHVHSALWWIAMLFAVAALFGKLLPRRMAFLALLFFTVDESHTLPFGWIANRCSVCSMFFGTLGLLAYLRFRERSSRLAAGACALSFALAVAFGEYGLSVVPYVAAYELWRWEQARRAGDPRSRAAALLQHALAMLPVIVPCLIYLVVRRALERGPLHSGVYVGPDGDLFGFLWLLVQRVPVLFVDLFAGMRSDSWNIGNLMVRPLYEAGYVNARWMWLPGPWRHAHSAMGAFAMVVALFAWRFLDRKIDRDAEPEEREALKHVRWLAWGSVLSLLPVVGSFPSGRLVSIAEIGMAAVLACAVVLGLRDLAPRLRVARTPVLLGAAAAAVILSVHLLVAAQDTYGDSLNVKYAASAIRKTNLTMEASRRRLPLQRVALISALEYGSSIYIPYVLQRHGRKPPRSSWTLSLSPAPHVLLRDSETSFRLAPTDGFALLTNAPEEMFSDPNAPFEPGDEVDIGGLKITVLETSGPHIHSIRVEADVPLDDPSLLFIVSTPSGLRRFHMPRIGEVAHIAAPVVPTL